MQANESDKFAVFSEVEGNSQPLLMLDLSFGRLMDEIVMPYQTDQPFFVDGAPLKRSNLKRLKILRLGKHFASFYSDLNYQLRMAGAGYSKMIGEQYHLRLEAILRENGEDVTSQIISAFDKTIKPSLKDYLPKRQELINAAFDLFVASVKQLAGLPAAA